MAVTLVNEAREHVNESHLYPAPGPHSMPLGSVCWSPAMEAQAQAWANQVIQSPGCGADDDAGYNNPNNPGNWGENNYAWTGSDTGIVTRATNAFLAEQANYVYDWKGPFKNASDGPMEPMPFDAQSADSTPDDPSLPENEGKVIGHYTVIIWRTMSEFGCAFAARPMCTQVVCFYGPGAGINTLGVAPY
jgi:Cysteine-rich secretory protein family